MGRATAGQLDRLEIRSCLDLLLHLPYRWQRRTRYEPLANLFAAQECLVLGKVISSRTLPSGRRSWEVRIGDDTGTLTLRFFHYSRFQVRDVSPGDWMRCFGVVRPGPKGLEMIHPEYRAAKDESPPPPDMHDAPVYASTAGLAQNKLCSLVRQVLAKFDRQGWPDIEFDAPLNMFALDALALLHQPPADTTDAELARARDRLAVEELTSHLVKSLIERRRLGEAQSIALPRERQLGRRMLRELGFRLTRAQSEALKTILPELEQAHPMLRLLQGDVGSGKTVVAAFAALRAAENGHQAAIMAPTEMLAEQHLQTFRHWLEPLGVRTTLLTGAMTGNERAASLEEITSGQSLVVVGTHALFQKDVQFDSLALVIIDEQHRFGVYQRLALKSKGLQPHQLVMTATPIPRTLAMTMYAHMDHIKLDELPPGRTPVSTRLMGPERRQDLIHRVGETCQADRQAYWVCTRIEESEEEDIRDVQNTADELRGNLDGVRVEALHGRMSAGDKQALMEAFRCGEIRVLVATTVIEVGVDVPNASLMIIENPERLGLAQLHQLRGRVGRGAEASHCLLLHGSEISQSARQRLQALIESSDGFLLAEKDLQLRGEGELTGTRQSGLAPYRVADLRRDTHLLSQAHEAAKSLVDEGFEAAYALQHIWVREVSDVSTV